MRLSCALLNLNSFLRIGRSSAYELCRQNEFPVVRIGKSIRIPKKALLDWIEYESNKANGSGQYLPTI
ncbi:MAG: helix-turn-helix domain-containing protein [Firmicutes bacterium]|nr:helix-turn-helix domain-containing protein [Bacillota bacterium]